MQKVEYNEKLSVYKSMKRADGAGTTEQERNFKVVLTSLTLKGAEERVALWPLSMAHSVLT